MPDMERITRSLELHLAVVPEDRAFIQGKHAGLDAARWQIVKVSIVVAIATVILLGSDPEAFKSCYSAQDAKSLANSNIRVIGTISEG